MAKIKVGVLNGGISLERDISLLSANNVLQHLSREKYHIFNIIVNKKAQFFCDNKEIKPEHLANKIDIALSVLHGVWGEDGQIQTILDNNNVVYIGSDALSSKNSFSKITAKKILQQNDINTPDYIVLDKNTNYTTISKTLTTKFLNGCVVKIANSGSSFGVFVCNNEQEINNALDKINSDFSNKDNILVEEYISGTEYTCGVIDNKGYLDSLPIIELVPKKSQSFFDFTAKYEGKSEKTCPAKITQSLTKNIQKIALYVHKIFKLADFSRTDFIYNDNNELFVLEVNTLPCMAKTSLFCQELRVKGINFSDFLNDLIVKKLNNANILKQQQLN